MDHDPNTRPPRLPAALTLAALTLLAGILAYGLIPLDKWPY
jgi:hypothetical protein